MLHADLGTARNDGSPARRTGGIGAIRPIERRSLTRKAVQVGRRDFRLKCSDGIPIADRL